MCVKEIEKQLKEINKYSSYDWNRDIYTKYVGCEKCNINLRNNGFLLKYKYEYEEHTIKNALNRFIFPVG